MVWCIVYKRELGKGVVYCPMIVQWYYTRVGNAGWRGGGGNGWLIREQQPRSKRISCKGHTGTSRLAKHRLQVQHTHICLTCIRISYPYTCLSRVIPRLGQTWDSGDDWSQSLYWKDSSREEPSACAIYIYTLQQLCVGRAALSRWEFVCWVQF